jgi:drug/metabolite transporter (DMT)-like permease
LQGYDWIYRDEKYLYDRRDVLPVSHLILGATFPIMTSALTRCDPYTFTTLRYGFAGLALVVALGLREGRQGLSLKGQRVGLAWLLGSAGFVGFGFWSSQGSRWPGKTGR